MQRVSVGVKGVMPKGLFARALLIIIAPMVLLQSVVAFMFMERHYNLVTQRLSAGVVQDIATLIEVYKLSARRQPHAASPHRRRRSSAWWSTFCRSASCRRPDRNRSSRWWTRRSRRRCAIASGGHFGSTQSGVPRCSNSASGSMMPSCAYSFRAARPMRRTRISFWDGWSAPRSCYHSRGALPAQPDPSDPRLADAAESFGKGREVPDFRPRGAREVRRAAQAFIEMKRRIERTIEQRTAMLAGVSHDLRTILTRFKLELAMLADSPNSRP